MGGTNGVLRLQRLRNQEDRYAKITSPFLFKMKNTLRQRIRPLIED